MIKPVDSVVSQKRKLIREGSNDKIDNFEIKILDEGALDKVPTVPGKQIDKKT